MKKSNRRNRKITSVIFSEISSHDFPALPIPISNDTYASEPTSMPDSDIILRMPSADSKSPFLKWARIIKTIKVGGD